MGHGGGGEGTEAIRWAVVTVGVGGEGEGRGRGGEGGEVTSDFVSEVECVCTVLHVVEWSV